jgi:monoamine oxidase
MAIPPHFAARVTYRPCLPPRRDQLTQRMPIGSSIKCLAFYDRPFWREKGYSGATVSTRGPIHFTFDACTHDGRRSALVGFMLGDQARHWSSRPEAERRQAAVDAFARLLGPEAASPVAYIDKDWNSDPWIRGCSVGLMASGAMTTCGEALREPVGRIHWAGTETATQWCGFMDGAVESGERAAREVVARL